MHYKAIMMAALFAIGSGSVHAVTLSFNTSGSFTNSFRQNSMGVTPRYSEASAGGIGNSAAIAINAGSDTTALLTNTVFSFSMAGRSVTSSAMVKLDDNSFASTLLQVGFSGHFDGLFQGGVSNAPFMSLRVQNVETSGLSVRLEVAYKVRADLDPVSITVVSGVTNLVPGRWYRLNTEFANAGSGDVFISGSFVDYGTNGTTAGATVLAVSNHAVSGGAHLTTDASVFAGFRAFSGAGTTLLDLFEANDLGQPYPSAYTGVFRTSAINGEFWMYTNDYYYQAGKAPSIINFFIAWRNNSVTQSFPNAAMNRIRTYGSIPMLTWEPWDAFFEPEVDADRSLQPEFNLASIINGDHDNFITTWAAQSRAWGHPYFLRFAHEMNGNWYPWCAAVNDNKPGEYVKAWRHVHDIFVREGATNVTWVWNVNRFYSTASSQIGPLYPGDNYVDWLAVNGYNRGAIDGNSWRNFSNAFYSAYQSFIKLAPGKPVMIAETGCTEKGGDKGGWFRNALRYEIKFNYARIKAWVYFDIDKNGFDNRIVSTEEARTNYAFSVGLSYYASNLYGQISGVIPPLLNDELVSSDLPPFVTIVEPRFDHVEMGSTQIVRIVAMGKAGITNVSLTIDNSEVYSGDADPYQVDWTVSTTLGSVHTLTALARDGLGNGTTSSVQVLTVDTTPPQVQITSPTTNDVIGGRHIQIVAAASDLSDIDKVEFYINGELIRVERLVPYDAWWTVPNETLTPYEFMVIAYDHAGNTSTHILQGLILSGAPPPPEVYFLEPVSDAVPAGSNVVVVAEVLAYTNVVKVDFYLDGIHQLQDTVAPYQFTWSVPETPGMGYLLTAIAQDMSANISTAITQVTSFDNAPPVVQFTKPTSTVLPTGAEVECRVEAEDISGMDRIDYYINGSYRWTERIWPYQYWWTIPPVSGASYEILVMTYDNVGNVASNTLTIIAYDPYDMWRYGHFSKEEMEDTDIGGDAATPADDGWPNLAKYALGLAPFVPVCDSVMALSVSNQLLTITYPQRKNMADIQIIPEVGYTLDRWDYGPGQVETSVVQDLGGGMERVRARDVAPDPDHRLRLVRLRVLRAINGDGQP